MNSYLEVRHSDNRKAVSRIDVTSQSITEQSITLSKVIEGIDNATQWATIKELSFKLPLI